MAANFFDYLKPTLIICNFLGVTYIPTTKSSVATARIVVLLFPLPFYSYYVYAFYVTSKNINHLFARDSAVASIGDFVGKVLTGLCLLTKGFYYLLKKDKMKKFIAHVRSTSSTILAMINSTDAVCTFAAG